MNREKFSRCTGKLFSRLFRLVTMWKDSNLKNYTGIEKSKAKYCLVGSDPVYDNIVMDLTNLKSANARHLIYEQLDIHQRKRSKYELKL